MFILLLILLLAIFYLIVLGFSQQWSLLILYFIGLLHIIFLYLPWQKKGKTSRAGTIYALGFALGIFMMILSVMLLKSFPVVLALSVFVLFLLYQIIKSRPLKESKTKEEGEYFISFGQSFGYRFVKLSPIDLAPYDLCFIGDRLFDFSELLLAKKKPQVNLMQLYGHMKIVVPANLPVNFYFHGLRTRLFWQGVEYTLNNETQHFEITVSKATDSVEVSIFQGLGEIEVVLL